MVGAMACFIVNDSLVKYASQTMPATQLIFARGIMASALVLGVAWATGATRRIREVVQGWVAFRAVVDAMATMLFLVSLFHLPLANATAINMTSPLIISVLAAMLLAERLGPARWIAISVGFVGVLFIIQPRADGFDGYALVCLAVDRAAVRARCRDAASCTLPFRRSSSRCRTRSPSRRLRRCCRCSKTGGRSAFMR
jgi:drug/metabolite transporter (DMT)-like permease